MSYKKFTNLSGAKVGKEPKIVQQSNEELELLEFKNQVLKLMDDFLTIRSYGVARPEIMIPTRIVGKELFLEALEDLLSQKTSKEVVKTLESLKSVNKDWKSIEEKIESVRSIDRNITEEKKINQIIEKWGSDEETLKGFLNNWTNRLSKTEINEKSKLLESMIEKNSNHKLKLIQKSLIDSLNESMREEIILNGYEQWLDRDKQVIYDSETARHGLTFDVAGEGENIYILSSRLSKTEKDELKQIMLQRR
jgi:hypothetical protein